MTTKRPRAQAQFNKHRCPHCDFRGAIAAHVGIHMKNKHPEHWKGPSSSSQWSKQRYHRINELIRRLPGGLYGCPVCDHTNRPRSTVYTHVRREHRSWNPVDEAIARGVLTPEMTLSGHIAHPVFATLKTLVAQLREIFEERDRHRAVLDNITKLSISGIEKPRNGLKRLGVKRVPETALQLPQFDGPTEVQPS